MSLPGDSSSPFLKNKENWDDDFDFAGDINVPTKVVENQMSLQMDLDNIKDFASQIEGKTPFPLILFSFEFKHCSSKDI
jgi:hypothetical protein